MTCPSCGAAAEEGAAVCQKCDHILDPSLFSSEPPEPDDTPAPAAPAKPRAKAQGSARKPPNAEAAPSRRAMPEAPVRKPKPARAEPAADWHVQPGDRAASSTADSGSQTL